MSLEIFKRNERLEEIFNRVAKQYDTLGPKYFAYFGKKLVEHVSVGKGTALLDVAFGKGASLIPASQYVGGNGRVIGIDFSQEMVKELQLLIHEKQLYNTNVLQMDAEILDFHDNIFDYVLCGLSLPLFSDSIGAINEMYRVLKVGGRLGISTWNKREKMGVLEKAYIKLIPNNNHQSLNNDILKPDFSSIEGIEKILKNVGLKNIDILIEEKTFYYKDEEEWWQEQWTNASRGLFEHIESMGADVLERFKEIAFIEIIENKDTNGIPFDAKVIFSIGQK